jgi:hypothetical protein
MDSDKGTKAQSYLFRPAGYYTFSGTASDAGSSLTYTSFTNNGAGLTVDQAYDIMDNILFSLKFNEDIGIMSGDIRKAYGDKLYVFTQIPTDYTVVPIYDKEVLVQIHNATNLNTQQYAGFDATGDGILPGDSNITQSNGAIICAPRYNTYRGTRVNTDKILNLFDFEPSPEITMVATRLQSNSKVVGTSGDVVTCELTTAGSEVVTNIDVWTYSNGLLNVSPGRALVALRRERNSPFGVFFLLAFSFAPFESKEKADKKCICLYDERCF